MKKVIAGLLILVLCFGVVGCSGGNAVSWDEFLKRQNAGQESDGYSIKLSDADFSTTELSETTQKTREGWDFALDGFMGGGVLSTEFTLDKKSSAIIKVVVNGTEASIISASAEIVSLLNQSLKVAEIEAQMEAGKTQFGNIICSVNEDKIVIAFD